MSDIYAIYNPKTDRVVGIYGTHKTLDDDHRKMLETVDQPGGYWHKETQVHPDSWQDPHELMFVLLDNFTERSDRQRLVGEWREKRFSEARAIAKMQAEQTTPGRSTESETPDHSDSPFVERIEHWVQLTTSLFGGDIHSWIRNSSDSDRERAKRLLRRKVDGDKACALAEGFYNALNNYDKWPDMFAESTAPSDDDHIPI